MSGCNSLFLLRQLPLIGSNANDRCTRIFVVLYINCCAVGLSLRPPQARCFPKKLFYWVLREAFTVKINWVPSIFNISLVKQTIDLTIIKIWLLVIQYDYNIPDICNPYNVLLLRHIRALLLECTFLDLNVVLSPPMYPNTPEMSVITTIHSSSWLDI